MPSNPITRELADHCVGCDLAKVPPSKVLDTLRRLPERLFNLADAKGPDLQWEFDDNAMLDFNELAYVPLAGATLQYAITRVFVGLKDLGRTILARATALTLGTGRFTLATRPAGVGRLRFTYLSQALDGDGFWLQNSFCEFDDDNAVVTGAIRIVIGANVAETWSNAVAAIGANIPGLAPIFLPAVHQVVLTGVAIQFTPGVGHGTRYTFIQSIVAGGVETRTQCPHAFGRDLERLGEELGVGRPFGFTDCCYWRLIQLLNFIGKGAGSPWHLREVVELYVGARPDFSESPAKITLSFPGDVMQERRDVAYYDRGFLGRGFIGTGGVPLSLSVLGAGYYGATTAPSYLGPSLPKPQSGITLRQALNRVKVEGVFVSLVNLPPLGRAGCVGATYRGRPKTMADAFLY